MELFGYSVINPSPVRERSLNLNLGHLSYSAMSKIANGKLVFPKVSVVRQLPGQTRIDGVFSIASSHGSNPTVQEKMDHLDTSCIITRVHRHTDEMTHIVNAQRGDTTMKDEVVS